MLRKLYLICPLMAVTVLVAADPPPWIGKRVAEWNEKEAFEVLADSPWSRSAAPTVLPALTGFERRDGGNMAAQGGGQGMQVDRLKDFSVIGTKSAQVRPGQGPESPKIAKLLIRWETALPIRAAEFKTNDVGVPEINGEDYAIAIYDISFKLASIDKLQLKDLSGELKKISMLKIEGRTEGVKEVEPSRVSVLELGAGMATVVYLFPRSAGITVNDTRIEFDAQIGRLAIAQYFFPPEMAFQGKLEL